MRSVSREYNDLEWKRVGLGCRCNGAKGLKFGLVNNIFGREMKNRTSMHGRGLRS